MVQQMNMLLDLVKTSPAFSSLKSITNVRTLTDIVNTSPLTAGIFSEVAKLLLMFLTIPVTTATAERSF